MTTPAFSQEPSRSKLPISPKSGVSTIESGSAGTLRFQPLGFTPSSVNVGPTAATFSTTIATIVVTTIEIRIAPLTRATYSAMTSTRPITKTRTGQPASLPPMPSSTGTGPTPVRRTNPASTRPIRAMKRPMPTEIATLSCPGTALKTASRKPVMTSSRMIRPSITTRPIASAHVIWVAIEKVTKALRPRPVASASG